MITDQAPWTEWNVSRETMARLQKFEDILRKWNPRINLVSSASLDNLWSRHIADSIQVYKYAPHAGHWLDLGSGGGFPGLIAAILAAEDAPDLRFTLVESDQRKAAFLRNAAREAGIRCDIRASRIETLPPRGADIVSARAVADLAVLLGYASRHLSRDGFAFFPKGETWEKEVSAAQEKWQFRYEAITSVTDSKAVILKIEGASLV